jgi:hypothetical protein
MCPLDNRQGKGIGCFVDCQHEVRKMWPKPIGAFPLAPQSPAFGLKMRAMDALAAIGEDERLQDQGAYSVHWLSCALAFTS